MVLVKSWSEAITVQNYCQWKRGISFGGGSLTQQGGGRFFLVEVGGVCMDTVSECICIYGYMRVARHMCTGTSAS